MNVREAIGRVVVGIVFGFVLGIVLYQSAQIESQIVPTIIVNAEENECITLKNPGEPCPPGSEYDLDTYCYTIGSCTCEGGETGTCGAGSCLCLPTASSSSLSSHSTTSHSPTTTSSSYSSSFSSSFTCCNTTTNTCQ